MNSIDIEVIHTALDWLGRGRRVVLGTVVRTWGSAPRPPGSMMIIRDDGQVAGSVSGGCIEDDLIRRVAAGDLALHRPEATIYGQTAEEVRRFGLPCGGSVQVVLEPLGHASGLDELLRHIESSHRVQRSLDMQSGAVRLAPAGRGGQMSFDGQVLRSVHGPQLRLLIIGGGQLSRYLASMAVMLDYRVTVCEPRTEYHEGWDGVPGVSLSTRMPDDEVLAMQPDDSTAVVALTHDPKLDDLALMEALRSQAFYVGALGSRHNNDKRRERLLEFDVTPVQAARLHGPVGLRLGGLTPPEIAMSIVAEMTAVQRGADIARNLTDWSGSETVCLSS